MSGMNLPLDAQSALALLKSSSLAHAVQQEVERAILSGEMPPGTQLIEADVADRLGVSRGPVREALRRLEQSGLVRQHKNRGTFVHSLPLDEVAELFDVRAVVEEEVGRRLATTISAAQLKSLRAVVADMERAAKDNDSARYHALNVEFHAGLVEINGNRRLVQIHKQISTELSLFRRFSLSDAARLPASLFEHRDIIKAIATGDPRVAGQALRAHVEASKARALSHQTRRA